MGAPSSDQSTPILEPGKLGAVVKSICTTVRLTLDAWGQPTVERAFRTVFSLPRFENPEREHRNATMRYEPWRHGVLAVDRLPSRSGVPPVCGPLPWG